MRRTGLRGTAENAFSASDLDANDVTGLDSPGASYIPLMDAASYETDVQMAWM